MTEQMTHAEAISIIADKQEEIEALRAQLAEVTRERDEESRQADHWAKAHGEMMERRNEVLQQLLATQAHVARLEYALSQWQEGSLNEPHLSICYRLTDEALSTPINLDALHEDRARTLEDAAEVILKLPRITGGVILPQSAYACLRDYLAPQHRAKKESK